jgi:hypothetical protein
VSEKVIEAAEQAKGKQDNQLSSGPLLERRFSVPVPNEALIDRLDKLVVRTRRDPIRSKKKTGIKYILRRCVLCNQEKFRHNIGWFKLILNFFIHIFDNSGMVTVFHPMCPAICYCYFQPLLNFEFVDS